MADPNTIIPLGSEVEDFSTGFKGMVTRRLESSEGYTQYAVTPRSTDGSTMPEAVFLDPHTIDILNEGISKNLPAHQPDPVFDFGAIVKDVNTDFKGTIIHKFFDLNGCCSYAVIAAKLLPKTGKAAISILNQNSIKLVKAAPAAKVEKIKQTAAKSLGPAPSRWGRGR